VIEQLIPTINCRCEKGDAGASPGCHDSSRGCGAQIEIAAERVDVEVLLDVGVRHRAGHIAHDQAGAVVAHGIVLRGGRQRGHKYQEVKGYFFHQV